MSRIKSLFLLGLFTILASNAAFATQHSIATLADLKTLSTTSSWWADTINLTADINADSTKHWNSDSGFCPIGNNTTNFTGKFRGHGHVIKNLFINRSTTDYIGLFGYSTGTIDSLGISGGSVSGHQYVGGVMGVNSGTISNCYVTCSVSGINYYIGVLRDIIIMEQ